MLDLLLVSVVDDVFRKFRETGDLAKEHPDMRNNINNLAFAMKHCRCRTSFTNNESWLGQV